MHSRQGKEISRAIMATPELDLQQFMSDPEKFAEACGYMISPSFSLEQLKKCLAKDPSLAAATGRHGSAAFYAADRDGDEEFVSIIARFIYFVSFHMYKWIVTNFLIGDFAALFFPPQHLVFMINVNINYALILVHLSTHSSDKYFVGDRESAFRSH